MDVILTTVGNLVDLPKMTTLKRPPSDIHDVTVNYSPDIHDAVPFKCLYRVASCIKLLHLMP